MIGRNDGDTGGNVHKPDRAFNLVAVLASRTAAAKGLESYFLAEGFRICVMKGHVGIRGRLRPPRPDQTWPDAGSSGLLLKQSGTAEGVGHDAFRSVVGRVFLDLEGFDFLDFNGFLLFFLYVAYGK